VSLPRQKQKAAGFRKRSEMKIKNPLKKISGKKSVRLNGFNKSHYSLGEVIDLLKELGVKVNVDEKYDFAAHGRHFIVE
jgi:hypothetical protein